MGQNRQRLPVPQREFGFTPDTFNLIAESGIDGDRITRERALPTRGKEDCSSPRAVESGNLQKFARLAPPGPGRISLFGDSCRIQTLLPGALFMDYGGLRRQWHAQLNQNT